MTEKYEKTSFHAETNDFDQRTACRAPFCWLKYTTTGGVTETDSFLLIKKQNEIAPMSHTKNLLLLSQSLVHFIKQVHLFC